MVKFTAAAASDYDTRIPRFVPGYGLSSDIILALLLAEMRRPAEILVVGAGTGVDLVKLALGYPEWNFLAVDPSEGMLQSARAKVVQAGVGGRVKFVESAIEAYTPGRPADAAVAVLVGHFMPDTGERLAFMQAIARALKPGAPYLTVDTIAPEDPSYVDQAYQRWAMLDGLAEDDAAAMTKRVRLQHHGITADRFAALCAEAGFAPPVRFFRALAYDGFATRRR